MEPNRGIVLMKLVKTCVFTSAKIDSYSNQVSRDIVGGRRRPMEDAEQLEAVAYIFMFLFRCSLFCVGVILLDSINIQPDIKS